MRHFLKSKNLCSIKLLHFSNFMLVLYLLKWRGLRSLNFHTIASRSTKEENDCQNLGQSGVNTPRWMTIYCRGDDFGAEFSASKLSTFVASYRTTSRHSQTGTSQVFAACVPVFKDALVRGAIITNERDTIIIVIIIITNYNLRAGLQFIASEVLRLTYLRTYICPRKNKKLVYSIKHFNKK